LLANVALNAKANALSVTFPRNPRTLLRVMVTVADVPGFNDNENGRTEREKSGPITFTCT
jgi:hypothetical protein